MKKLVTQKLIDKYPELASLALDTVVDMPTKRQFTDGVRCDKNNPSDPHYQEAGYYTASCIWVPAV